MGINLGCPVFKIFICHIHCMCIDVHMCVDVRRQLVEVFSCLLPCGSWDPNLGLQARWPMPLPTEPSSQHTALWSHFKHVCLKLYNPTPEKSIIWLGLKDHRLAGDHYSLRNGMESKWGKN